MLKVKDLVPDIYYNQSRDFQFLGRTLEVVFNYLKMNIDLIEGLPYSNNSNDTMIPLLTKTLGFETKHDYNTQDLRTICGVFVELVRNKGTKWSIERACKTLMNAQNVGGYNKVVVDNDTYNINIYVPSDLQDLVLLEDLFDYILPAGYEYRFIKAFASDTNPQETYNVKEKLNVFKATNSQIGKIAIPAGADVPQNDIRPDAIDFNDDEDVKDDKDFGIIYTGKIGE